MEEKQEIKRLRTISRLGSYILLIIVLFLVFASIVLTAALFMPEISGEVFGVSGTDLYILLGTLLIEIVLLCLIMYAAYLLLKGLSSETTPFTRKNVKSLKNITLLLLVTWVSDNLIRWAISRTDGGVSYELSLSFILAAVIVYCITLIFQYGVALQEESDLTV